MCCCLLARAIVAGQFWTVCTMVGQNLNAKILVWVVGLPNEASLPVLPAGVPFKWSASTSPRRPLLLL